MKLGICHWKRGQTHRTTTKGLWPLASGSSFLFNTQRCLFTLQTNSAPFLCVMDLPLECFQRVKLHVINSDFTLQVIHVSKEKHFGWYDVWLFILFYSLFVLFILIYLFYLSFFLHYYFYPTLYLAFFFSPVALPHMHRDHTSALRHKIPSQSLASRLAMHGSYTWKYKITNPINFSPALGTSKVSALCHTWLAGLDVRLYLVE